MRFSSVKILLGLCAGLTAGCYAAHGTDEGPPRIPRDADPPRSPRDADPPRSPRDAGPDATRPPPPPTRSVDILFVVENTSEMSEEQASLAAEMPRLIDILATGDFDQDGDAFGDGEDGDPDFPPPSSIHFGVITTDMGSGGFRVPTCARSDFGDDGVFRTRGAPDCRTLPAFLGYGLGDSIADFASDTSCRVAIGTSGCGFEQPLEAALKALSPSAPTDYTAAGYTSPRFFSGTSGHGDGANDGFLREDSVLAIIMAGVEDDCSALDPELFNPSSATYGATDLNLRCFAHADAALHPISRFVSGLLALRRHPSRLVFSVIGGVPADLVPRAGESPDWDRLISDDFALRDDRMEERVDPGMPSRLIPSCNVPGRGVTFPPIRILQVARELEGRGAGVSVGSICQESYQETLAEIVQRLKG